VNPLVVVVAIGRVAFGLRAASMVVVCHAIARVVCWVLVVVLYNVCYFLLFVLAYSSVINT
jgi:hypothetical protein